MKIICRFVFTCCLVSILYPFDSGYGQDAEQSFQRQDQQDQQDQSQEQQRQQDRVSLSNPTRELKFSHPQKGTWEFGLEITASAPVKGITATVPVPIDWPEQSLKELPVQKSDNVARVSFKKPGPGVRQMVIRINSMRAGETAKILFVAEIEKRITVAPNETGHFVFAKKPPAKIRKFLTPSPYIESRDRKIIKLAKEIEIDENAPAWEQVETIYKWVREKIEYKFDTKIHTCLEAIEAGHGDCEELSSLFIAICRARGIPARAVWVPEHTYPEFYLEDDKGNGHWIPCQAAGQYEFGSMTEYKPVLQKGDNFRISGHKKPLRYVQPTLMAKDAAGPPSMKWVMNQVKVETVEDDKTGDDQHD